MAQTVNQQSIDWQAVGEETIRRLQDLLRLDTRNPPGNEIRAAQYLRGVFEAEGIPGEIVGPGGDRGTFIARLRGDGSAPPLLLMGHTDVVSNSCQICGQTRTTAVPTALRQSSQSVFLSHPDRLSSQVMPWK